MNNFAWDNYKILSSAFILETNSGKTNNVMHKMCTKNVMQNPEQFWKKYWNGTDHLMNFQLKYLPIYHSFVQAKDHHSMKKHCYIMKIQDQSSLCDSSGIQDVQSYSPEYNIIFQKYTAMKMDVFWTYIHY